jgi:hypothetical protein
MYLNYVISFETKVLLSQAYVTTVDFLALKIKIKIKIEREREREGGERERERESLVMRVELIY